MTSAAIYAWVSSARQKKDQTIGSQTQALREHAANNRLEVPEEWVFEDEGHSGATLVRPGLEALRGLAAQGCLDVVLVYSPDRLARKFAYQALLIEEFARAGVRVEFVKNGARGDSPEDQLLVQFQGMFAEYEKAQLMERYRRGKAHRARTGSVNVLSGAPFGYRYVRKTDLAGAGYQIVEDEAALVAELFRRYADEGASIADLARWLTAQGVPTRTGKHRWDRSVVWGMLRNPAYAGTAVFGKTMAVHEPAGLNRVARLQGRSVPRPVKTVDRPRDQWTEIPVPAIVSTGTFDRVQQRLADNKRFAARNTKVPSLLQGLAACSACGYGYYRGHATTTAGNTIYYYRCLGSDNYRYEGGRVCANKPVRADYLDTVVWDHISGLLADPALIRAEIAKRLEQAQTSDPVTSQRNRLETALAKATASVTAMIEALSEQLITIDELRSRMPHLRARETGLRGQLDALDAQAADRDAYLKLADNLEGFLARLRTSATTTSVAERQRVLRLLVKDVLIGPRRSPSGTASPHAPTAPPHAMTTPKQTRRVTMHRVIHCVGGVRSPLIFNVAMSALDEHMMEPWKPGGAMSTPGKRHYRRAKGAPTWRIIRYADDFVILVNGTRSHAEALREDVAAVLAPLGLRLSPAKTQVVHLSDGFSFLGFRIRWKRKRGSGKWSVDTVIGHRPIQSVKAKIRALTHRTSQQDLARVLTRLGQITRGWASYFKHAVAKWTFSKLDAFTWWRLARMLRARHGWSWGKLRQHLVTPDGRWLIAAGGVEYFRIQSVTVSRYAYRGNKIPSPWPPANPA